MRLLLKRIFRHLGILFSTRLSLLWRTGAILYMIFLGSHAVLVALGQVDVDFVKSDGFLRSQDKVW